MRRISMRISMKGNASYPSLWFPQGVLLLHTPGLLPHPRPLLLEVKWVIGDVQLDVARPLSFLPGARSPQKATIFLCCPLPFVLQEETPPAGTHAACGCQSLMVGSRTPSHILQNQLCNKKGNLIIGPMRPRSHKTVPKSKTSTHN